MREELAEQAMSIILFAGDARTYCEKALNDMAGFDFESAQKNLERCDENILKAHAVHTKLVQKEAGGEQIEYSVLFAHSQDTLMTISIEIRLAKKMLEINKAIERRLEALEMHREEQ